MPKPGPARVPIVNGDFESARPGMSGNPEGWFSIQHAGDLSYTFKLDTEQRHSGERSVRVDNVGPEPFGSIYQQVSAQPFRGKTVRITAWLRTRGVTGSATGPGAVLLLQSMRSGAVLTFNHMRDNPQTGDREWTRQQIELAVPADAEQVEFGAMLHGPGSLWMDDVELALLPK